MTSDIVMGQNVTTPGAKYIVYKSWLASQVGVSDGWLIFFLILFIVIFAFFVIRWRNNNRKG